MSKISINERPYEMNIKLSEIEVKDMVNSVLVLYLEDLENPKVLEDSVETIVRENWPYNDEVLENYWEDICAHVRDYAERKLDAFLEQLRFNLI